MHRRQMGTVLAALLSGVLAGCAPGVSRLVQNGQPMAAIYVAPSVMAPDSKDQLNNPALEAEMQRRRLRESVKDLALSFEKMSGAKVAVVPGEPHQRDGRVPILIGGLASKEFGPVGKSYPYKQAFRVVVARRGVGLYGESDLATSYAIYELLDRLGCRWFMPSEMGARRLLLLSLLRGQGGGAGSSENALQLLDPGLGALPGLGGLGVGNPLPGLLDPSLDDAAGGLGGRADPGEGLGSHARVVSVLAAEVVDQGLDDRVGVVAAPSSCLTFGGAAFS